jgi:hypothetical protein
LPNVFEDELNRETPPNTVGVGAVYEEGFEDERTHGRKGFYID